MMRDTAAESTQRAYQMGLVSGVIPNDPFNAEVRAVARQIAEGPAEALGIAKQLINQAAGVDRIDVHLDREIDQLARIASGSDFAEGLAAFFEKRPPHFGGSNAAHPAASNRFVESRCAVNHTAS